MFSLIVFYSSAIDGHSKRKVLETFNMNYKNVFSFLKVIPWFYTAHLLLRITRCTNININHKGLQRTANEYAGKRRIYKDLISKNEK